MQVSCSQTTAFFPFRLCIQVFPLQFFNCIWTTLIYNSYLFFLSQPTQSPWSNIVIISFKSCSTSVSLLNSTHLAKLQILMNQSCFYPHMLYMAHENRQRNYLFYDYRSRRTDLILKSVSNFSLLALLNDISHLLSLPPFSPHAFCCHHSVDDLTQWFSECGFQTSSISISWEHAAAVQSPSRVRLCDPINSSTPGFPVCHHLPELAQTHVH